MGLRFLEPPEKPIPTQSERVGRTNTGKEGVEQATKIFSAPFKYYLSQVHEVSLPIGGRARRGGGEWETARTRREIGTSRACEIQSRCRSDPASGYNQKSYSVSVAFGFLFVKREPPSLTL